MAATKSGGSKRGFAAMDPAKQREIASKGGKASHGGGRKASGHRYCTCDLRNERRATSHAPCASNMRTCATHARCWR